MGTELGATTTVFPSDEMVRRFLRSQGRGDAWRPIAADEGAGYDETDVIDLSSLEPLIALPSSPGNVVPVREVAGREIYQAYIGSSANPGLRDFVLPVLMVAGKQVAGNVSFDVNPTSRQMLENLAGLGHLEQLIHYGARIHQAGCGGCIGMGQAPATGKISLRTVPRNFPGRSGTKEVQVYLCSPETAAASALTGVITDPRTLSVAYPKFTEPETLRINTDMLIALAGNGSGVALEKGPNIKPLPTFAPLPDDIACPVLLRTGDDISTDEIMPAGAEVLPFRSNIPEISKFAFSRIEENFHERPLAAGDKGFVVVAGRNYGQGSSREHAALAPRHLGLRVVIAKSFARIHRQNLINFGILPLTFDREADYDDISMGDELRIDSVREVLESGGPVFVRNTTRGGRFKVRHSLSPRQTEIVLSGGMINVVRGRKGTT
jgi:aconitate hydratase